MLYFSNAPVRPDSVIEEQYRALRQFRDRALPEGLVETYESLAEFREKLSRQLTRVVLDYHHSMAGTAAEPPAPPATEPVPARLSPEEKALLLAAADDPSGNVFFLRTGLGLIVQSNEAVLSEQRGDARTEANWEAALESLFDTGLLVERGQQREVFQVTRRGYETADALRSS